LRKTVKVFLYLAGVLTGLVTGAYASGNLSAAFIIALAVFLAGSVGLMFAVYLRRIVRAVNPFYLNRVLKEWHGRIGRE
jgi:hypothetical protein